MIAVGARTGGDLLTLTDLARNSMRHGGMRFARCGRIDSAPHVRWMAIACALTLALLFNSPLRADDVLDRPVCLETCW